MVKKAAKSTPKKATKKAAPKAKPAIDPREALLLATLPYAGIDGWGEFAILQGAQDCKMSEEQALELFPGGPAEMIGFFAAWADERMQRVLPFKEMEKLRVRDRVAIGVRARLEVLSPFKEATAATLTFFARPWHAADGLRQLYDTVDSIWQAAGDESVDYNYYTKRVLLAGVYTSTLLFWLKDESEDHEETWAFLDRRIENVMKIEKIKGKLKERCGK